MALAKTSQSVTQLTSSGTSSSYSVSGGISVLVSLYHSNGTGTVSAAATAQIQYQVNGASRWYAPLILLVTFGTSTSSVEPRSISLPDSITAVKITYTAPTGATGYSLDAEIAITTP